MKNFKEIGKDVLYFLGELIVGVLLLIEPIRFTKWVIMAAGIGMIILGLVQIVKYFRSSMAETLFGGTLFNGLIAILAGGFCVLKTEWFLVTFPVLTILYGVATLMGGIAKIQLTVDMFRRKNRNWFWPAINAALSIICAIVILNSPFTSTAALWVFTGISLIVEGVFDFVALILGRKAEKGSVA